MIMVGFGSRQFTHQTAYQRRSLLAKPGAKASLLILGANCERRAISPMMVSWLGRAESSMTHRPTARRFTGASPTQAVLLGDAPYRPRGQEGSATTTITRDCPGSLTRGSSRRTNPSSTTPTTATGWERE